MLLYNHKRHLEAGWQPNTHGYADFCHKLLISMENLAGPPGHYEKADMIGIKI